MTGVFADHANDPLTADHLALVADRLHRWSDFHGFLSQDRQDQRLCFALDVGRIYVPLGMNTQTKAHTAMPKHGLLCVGLTPRFMISLGAVDDATASQVVG